MKANIKKRIAKEWIILLISVIAGFPLLVLVFSLVATLNNPTSKWKVVYSNAWWNRISQKDIELFKIPEWDGIPAILDESHERAIRRFENDYEKAQGFKKLSFFEKYQVRRRFFDSLYDGMYFIAERELAELTFHKINMEADIDFLKGASIWVDPPEVEDLNQSRVRWAQMILKAEPGLKQDTKWERFKLGFKMQWRDIWGALGEGLEESDWRLAIIVLAPYLLSILLRSVVWAIRNARG